MTNTFLKSITSRRSWLFLLKKNDPSGKFTLLGLEFLNLPKSLKTITYFPIDYVDATLPEHTGTE